MTRRLWGRSPDDPLFQAMGAVVARCKRGENPCPIQFPLLQKGKDTFVAPASGELLTYANDLPFMYHNNKGVLRFTIEEVCVYCAKKIEK